MIVRGGAKWPIILKLTSTKPCFEIHKHHEVVVHIRHPNEIRGKQGNQSLSLYTPLPLKFCGQSHLLRFGSSRGAM